MGEKAKSSSSHSTACHAYLSLTGALLFISRGRTSSPEVRCGASGVGGILPQRPSPLRMASFPRELLEALQNLTQLQPGNRGVG